MKLLHRRREVPLLDFEIIQFFQQADWADGICEINDIEIGKEIKFGPSYIPVVDVSTFKGLEADAVILIVKRKRPELEKLLYVGVSRARAVLVIMTDELNKNFFLDN